MRSSTMLTPFAPVTVARTGNAASTATPFLGVSIVTLGGIAMPTPNRLVMSWTSFCVVTFVMPRAYGQLQAWLWPVHGSPNGDWPLTQSLPHVTPSLNVRMPLYWLYVIGSLGSVT